MNDNVADAQVQTHKPSDQRTLIELLRSYRAFVAGVVLAFWLVAAAAAFLMTPVYQAAIVVLPTTGTNGMAGGGGMAGSLGGLGSILGLGQSQSHVAIEAEALLKSQDFVEQFIQDHGLMRQLFANRWNATKSRWRTSWIPNSGPPTLYEAYRLFVDKVRSVEQNKKGVITVTIDWTNPAYAARWANAMIRDINQEMRQRAIRRAQAMIDALNNELKTAHTVEERDAIAHGLVSYVRARALAQARPDYAFTVISSAVPPNKRDYIRPQRLLYLIGGPALGFLFALFVLVTWDYCIRRRTFFSEQYDGTAGSSL